MELKNQKLNSNFFFNEIFLYFKKYKPKKNKKDKNKGIKKSCLDKVVRLKNKPIK